MEDSKIIEELFARSESVLSEIDQKYGRLCHKLANQILNNLSDAQECVNDAYLGVWNSIPPNRPQSFVGYLCRIVRNVSLKRYRYNTAEKRNSQMDVAIEELEGCLSSSDNVEKQIEMAELSQAIDRFLGQLKQSDRVIFLRRYYFSDSYEEIAELAGISEKNVSVRLSRIRNKLRESLKAQGYLI